MESHSVLGNTYLNLGGEKLYNQRKLEATTGVAGFAARCLGFFPLPPTPPHPLPLHRITQMDTHSASGDRECEGRWEPESSQRAASRGPPAPAGAPANPLPRARGLTASAAPARRPRTPRRQPAGGSLARARRRRMASAAAAPLSRLANRSRQRAGTQPAHPRWLGPPTALHAIHPPLPGVPSTSPSFSPAPRRDRLNSQFLSRFSSPAPQPSSHRPSHMRPTCRRGHFSKGPSL